VLYCEYGPYYVGLTKRQGLGKRLKDHLSDHLAEKWDRFSWFGFCSILPDKDNTGLCVLEEMAEIAEVIPESLISDVEALLIKSIGPRNINQAHFTQAEEWRQVRLDETEYYMSKVARV